MGSVSDEVTCPKCGGRADVDFRYRSDEYTMLCNTCGYHEEGDEHGVEKSGGHGAYRIQYDRFSRVGAFRTRKPARKRFRPALIANRRIVAITVTERVRGKWKQVVIKPNPSKSVQDWKQRMRWRNHPKTTFTMDMDDIEF